MTPNERPTPLTDAAKRPITANWNNEGDERRDVVFADFACTLERSLAERTEERDALKKAISEGTRLDYVVKSYEAMASALIAERDTALAKLAKCREALELFDLGVGFGVTEEMYDKRKSALEETK